MRCPLVPALRDSHMMLQKTPLAVLRTPLPVPGAASVISTLYIKRSKALSTANVSAVQIERNQLMSSLQTLALSLCGAAVPLQHQSDRQDGEWFQSICN